MNRQQDHVGIARGMMEPLEDLDASALRHLRKQTGITGTYLEQLYTFSALHRDSRARVISVAYYALVPANRLPVQSTSVTSRPRWFPFAKWPALAFGQGDCERCLSEPDSEARLFDDRLPVSTGRVHAWRFAGRLALLIK